MALEVFFINDMRYINPRFTYFTYLLTYNNNSTLTTSAVQFGSGMGSRLQGSKRLLSEVWW